MSNCPLFSYKTTRLAIQRGLVLSFEQGFWEMQEAAQGLDAAFDSGLCHSKAKSHEHYGGDMYT